MDPGFYTKLSQESIERKPLDASLCQRLLLDPEIELLSLLHAAFAVRQHYFGKEVTIHILNNAANGYCPEDCSYCAQSKNSTADIDEYGLKSDQEMLAEAQAAYENGAYRYCMVFAGRGPSPKRVDKICDLLGQIKEKFPGLKTCVSAGLMDQSTTAKLKAAGLDRMNHNLNTSRDRYAKICTTHTYDDRLNTLNAAREVGLDVCSGVIAGMGESAGELVELAMQLRELNARSIPVNFLLPIKGTPINTTSELTPQYCLRILCLFRLLNPDAEIRAAAGREHHLRSLEAMALYPANSLFLQGYLNTLGNTDTQTLKMIQDAGFTIKSDIPIEKLLNKPPQTTQKTCPPTTSPNLKTITDLRPALTKASSV